MLSSFETQWLHRGLQSFLSSYTAFANPNISHESCCIEFPTTLKLCMLSFAYYNRWWWWCCTYKHCFSKKLVDHFQNTSWSSLSYSGPVFSSKGIQTFARITLHTVCSNMYRTWNGRKTTSQTRNNWGLVVFDVISEWT